MDAALPFLNRAISSRRLEVALAMAAATGLTFRCGEQQVAVSGLVAREIARVGHSNIDAFRRGPRVEVDVQGVTYDSTEAQLRLLRLLSALPMVRFIEACSGDITSFSRARKGVRDDERKRRRCHRVHIERKACHGLPVSAWLDADVALTVDA